MGRRALARHTLWRATNMYPMKKEYIYPESMRNLQITTVWFNVVPNYCYKKLIE